MKSALADTASALILGLLETLGGGCRVVTLHSDLVSVLVETLGSDVRLTQLRTSNED